MPATTSGSSPAAEAGLGPSTAEFSSIWQGQGGMGYRAPDASAAPRSYSGAHASTSGGSGFPFGSVTVTYRRLEKGTFVRFQPLQHGFHEAVGDDVRPVLEAALMPYATLTEGDVVGVAHEGRTWTFKVGGHGCMEALRTFTWHC